MRTTGRQAAATVVVALLAATLLELLPATRVAHPRGVAAVAETAASLVGLAITGLLIARLRRTRGRRDLALVLAFALLTASALLWAAVPHALELDRGGLAGWASAACNAVAALCLVLASRSGRRPLGRRVIVACALFVVALEALAVIAALRLGPGSAPPVALTAGARLALAAAFALLAARAVAEDRRQATPFGRGLALGGTLGACALLSAGLHASLSTTVVGLGDLLRLAAFAVVLHFAVLDLRGHWRGLAVTAVEEERRRLARDLHDGLAQELAALVRCSAGDPRAHETAERALRDARAAIDALRHDAPRDRTPLEVLVAQAVGDAARRGGAEVDLVLDSGVRATETDRLELPRIAGQAVDNACAHAGAGRIEVRLSDAGGPCLAVRDDGDGLGARPACAGHGLRGMAERAARAGRRLRIRSYPGEGTTVEVTPG